MENIQFMETLLILICTDELFNDTFEYYQRHFFFFVKFVLY